MKFAHPILIFSFLLLLSSCSKENPESTAAEENKCGPSLIVSESEYSNAPNDLLTIESVNVEGDCLHIQFSAMGCDGESWEFKLIDSSHILDSDPCQRYLRLSLKNDENCSTRIVKDAYFDLSLVKGSNTGGIAYTLMNSGNTFLYEY